ncbi:MAG: GAF domain-containing protein [Ardenticatenales bacterium]|nr:GAF domain-containing protein [Ardenticatenales bacterium]
MTNGGLESPRSEEQWVNRDRLLYLLRNEQRFGVALRLLLLLVLPLVWTLTGTALPTPLFLFLWGGLLTVSLLVHQRLHSAARLSARRIGPWLGIGLLLDALLVMLTVLLDSNPQSDLYVLFALLALKGLFFYGPWRAARFLPFGVVPLYALTVVLRLGELLAWAQPFALRRGALLLLVAAASLYLGRLLYRAREKVRELNLRLGQRKTDVETRTQVLTHTATNLANRVLELRSLQEGMKAINASLELNELLRLVVDNASDVFGGASCAIGLREPDGDIFVSARSLEDDIPLTALGIDSLEALARQVLQQRSPALLGSEPGGDETLTSAMAVPMMADGEPLGALMAVRQGEYPFTADDQERLSAFADQAALAVKNSRLYERVEQLYQEVKERSEELKAVLDSIGDAVLVTGPGGDVRLTNPVANVILGLPDELREALLLQETLRGGFDEHLHTTLTSKSGDPVLGELTVHGGGLQGNRSYQALSAPLRDPDGRPRGVVTVLRDITAAKELEQLKSNFVSTISHELKTPLHSIKGFVNIILSEKSTGPLTEIQRDFLGTVHDQTTRLERMILDLLEFTRLESGQIKLYPEPLDLSVLAERVTEQLRPVAEESSVSLLCLVEEALPVEGDRLRVEQVFNNLIANAIKFTPPGGRVMVTGETGETCSTIIVRDTGIGIPEGEQERIFERFYQVDASHTRQYGGTGLGLAICKHIIERHSGRIWVESEVGQGSAFHFVLPHELAAATPLTVDFSRLEAG